MYDPEAERILRDALERGVRLAATRPRCEELGVQPHVAALGHDALLLEQAEEADRLRLDQLATGRVVQSTEVERRVGDSLAARLLLRRHHHYLIEEALERLVGAVDAELLERVDLEDLEPKDVEQPDREGRHLRQVLRRTGRGAGRRAAREVVHARRVGRERCGELCLQPSEEARVDCLREAVAQLQADGGRVGLDDPLGARLDLLACQRTAQALALAPKQLRGGHQCLLGRLGHDRARLGAASGESTRRPQVQPGRGDVSGGTRAIRSEAFRARVAGREPS